MATSASTTSRGDRADTLEVLRHVPPLPTIIGGACCIAFSAPLVALSDTGAGTASFYRCVIALPFLAGLVVVERRQRGRLTRRDHGWAFVAGALLGGDLLLWSQAIDEVGAGVSTVIVNLQVLLVPLLALLIDREALSRRFAFAVLPMLAGVALAGGVGSSGTGDAPVLGTVHAALAALCYAGYLFLLRRGSSSEHLVGPVLDVTVAAAVVSLVAGGLWQGIQFTPGWPAFAWLIALALSGQVVGWLLIAASLPRLASRTGASLLLLQPVGAVVLGWLLLGQHLTVLQLLGSALVLGAVLIASWHGTTREGD